jgi:hypothetical protein
MHWYRPTALAISSGEKWTAYTGDSNGNVTAFTRTHANAATASSSITSSNSNNIDHSNNGTSNHNSTTTVEKRFRSGSYTGGASLAVAPASTAAAGAAATAAGTARVALFQKSCSVLSDGSGGAGGLGATVKAMTAAQLGLGHVSLLLHCCLAKSTTTCIAAIVTAIATSASVFNAVTLSLSLPLIVRHGYSRCCY